MELPCRRLVIAALFALTTCLILPLAYAQAPSAGPPRSLDFSTDESRMTTLKTEGIRIAEPGLVAWFAKTVPEAERTATVKQLSTGVVELRAFLHLPRPWQPSAADGSVEYFIHPDRLVAHADVTNRVFLPVDLVLENRAPLLHETTHALLRGRPLGRPPEQRPIWLLEGMAEFTAKAVAKKSGLPPGDVFALGDVDHLGEACRSRRDAVQVFGVLPFIGGPGSPGELMVESRRPQVAPAFYACSASFVQFLAERFGRDNIVDLIGEQNLQPRLEELANASVAVVQKMWMDAIGLTVDPR
jgi:hypothetical protein